MTCGAILPFMKSPIALMWSALLFMGVAALVAWMWQSYPKVDPLGPTGAAWVQAVGSILAIIVSAGFALGVPLILERQRVQRYRKALITLLDGICREIESHKFWVETGGQESTKYVPGAFLALADQLERFPVYNLDDPHSIIEVAEAAHFLRQMVEDIRPELHRPRFVWERIHGQIHGIWQRSVWAKHRYGWGPANANPEPARPFGTDPRLAQHFTWDTDGNPTAIWHEFAAPSTRRQDVG